MHRPAMLSEEFCWGYFLALPSDVLLGPALPGGVKSCDVRCRLAAKNVNPCLALLSPALPSAVERRRISLCHATP